MTVRPFLAGRANADDDVDAMMGAWLLHPVQGNVWRGAVAIARQVTRDTFPYEENEE